MMAALVSEYQADASSAMEDGGPISSAVQAVLEPIFGMEQQIEPAELLKRVLKYTQSAAKNVDFQEEGIQEAVNSYCDNFFGTVLGAFNEKAWVGEVNWTQALVVAIKGLFPPAAVSSIPEAALDAHIVSCSERAYEEARFWYATDLWGTMQKLTDSKTTQKKIKAGLEAGWKEAWENARTSGEDFLRALIAGTVRKFAEATENPGNVLPEPAAGRLFAAVVAGGALPKSGDIGQEPPRDDWEPAVILPALQEAYAPFEPVPDLPEPTGVPTGGKRKKSGGGGGDWGDDWGGGSGYNPYGGKGGMGMMGMKGGKGMMGGNPMEMMNMMGAMMSQMQMAMGKGGMMGMGGKGGYGAKGW